MPSHVGIFGNKVFDPFAISTKIFHNCFLLKISYSDFLLSHLITLNKAYFSLWYSLPRNFVSKYRIISHSTPNFFLFHGFVLSRCIIVKFSHFRLGHNLLLVHCFHLPLNLYPYCTLNTYATDYDIYYLLLHFLLSLLYNYFL